MSAHPDASRGDVPGSGAATPSSTATLTDGTPMRRELSIVDQSTRLPFRRILVIYFAIGLALIVSFIDQTAVSTAAPQIGTDLNGSATISWVGTAFLVANCAFQLVYGRVSDIVGRKTMLLIATALLALGNLLCSFAQTPIQLYIFRAISGSGGGGINNIAMVIVSDIVPLKERGKYQGFISAATSLGNAIGPFIGGGLASAGQWRWLFRVTTFLGVITMVLDYFILPLKPVTGSAKEKLLKIDYAGIFLSAAATVLLLVPISGGGSTFAWSSATVIACLVVGALCAVGFVIYEWRFAKLPILPMRIFNNRTSTITMIQSFFIGMIYYGNIYYVPIFFQYVKGYSSLVSGAFVLVYTFPQAPWGIASGFYVSRTNHYKRVVVIGAVLWTLGLGLQIMWTAHSNLGMLLGFLEIAAIGIGFSLQTTLVAALAATANKDRAVVTAGRNFFRTLGGAFGLAIANAVYQGEVKSHLAAITALTPAQRATLVDSALNVANLPAGIAGDVRTAYALSCRAVYICFTVFSAVCIVCSLLIREVTFRKDTPELEAERRKAKGKDAEAGAVEDAAVASLDDGHRFAGGEADEKRSVEGEQVDENAAAVAAEAALVGPNGEAAASRQEAAAGGDSVGAGTETVAGDGPRLGADRVGE